MSCADQDYREAKEHLGKIQNLVKQGVLGRELMPEPDYWHWAILKPDELPEDMKYWVPFGEVRF